MHNKIRILGLHALQAFSPPLIWGCVFRKKGSARHGEAAERCGSDG